MPIATVVLAFLIGGLVVGSRRGHNPLLAYRDIFNGAGLNWIFHPTTNTQASLASYNLTQTLLQSTTLILTGLAVAFAFRCGMFNIGGQGQYFVGLVVANWLGVSFAGMSTLPHVLIAIVGATLAGAAWAGIAGVLKATTGAHEVISTIMLNWIAIYTATWLFGDGGPLQTTLRASSTNPVSDDIAHSAQLPVIWGSKGFQGLDIGFFIAIAALVVFWALINRTTLGYEVRAVGLQPRGGGVWRHQREEEPHSRDGDLGRLRGPRGRRRHARLPLPLRRARRAAGSQVGFLGIAVALLGRNTAVGVFFGAVLFGALIYGTNQGLTSNVIQPELAI